MTSTKNLGVAQPAQLLLEFRSQIPQAAANG